MKLLGLLLTICCLGTACNLEPGYYESTNNLFVKMRLSPQLDSVTFYFPDSSDRSSGLQKTTIEIYPNYRHGEIEVEGNQIHFKTMESDMLPSTRPELNPMKFEGNVIYLDCENMCEYLFGRKTLANCNQEFIEFEKI